MQDSGIDRRQRYLSMSALAALMIAVGVLLAVVWAGVGSDGAGNADREAASPVGAGNMGASDAENLPDGWSATALAQDAVHVTGISQVSAIRVVPRANLVAGNAAVASVTGQLAGRVICIDPGHASNTNPGTEPIGPGSTETKTTEPGGTSGIASGIPEHVVTLAIAMQLKQLLEAEGARVVMVREGETFNGLARDRPLIANQSGADLFVRIHCDGSTNQSANGASTIYPASIPGWTDDIADDSNRAAQSIQASLVSGLGVPDLGTVERSDMLGFNWSDVPAVLVEVGFMSNAAEDIRLVSPDYQRRVAEALINGIRGYFSPGQETR